MQDVIFSGTESRRPLSYAYVAITLDNGDRQLNVDYNEVTVARRVYRSGESEYLINGTAWAYLFLQLCQYIIDTHQILTLILKLLLRRGFSALIFYNPSRLVKKLPAFFRLAA